MSAHANSMVDAGAPISILRLLEAPGVGWSRTRRVMDWSQRHNLPLNHVVEDPAALGQTLTPPQVAAVQSNADEARRVVDGLTEQNIILLAVTDDAYPARLKTLLGKKSPPLIAVKGNQKLLSVPSVGFCGSRKATPKGVETAVDCATQLAAASVNVASGYAAGVDLATHGAALRAGGTTSVVLAEGILNFRVKRVLQDDWDWERTVVISEFLPSAKWTVGNAMQRNATICGLSDAMVLIESRLGGGSIDAGRSCLALGMPLFAPIYDGMPDSAQGNEEMLKSGALPLLKNRHSGLANVAAILETIRQQGTTRRAAKASVALHQPELPTT